MSEYPKVLLGIVTYDGKAYIDKEFFNNLKNLSYPNVDVFVVDNSVNKKYYNNLKRRGLDVKHINRGQNSREAQAKSLEVIRKKALKENYDYFMSIESDLLPPVDIIERLMSYNKQVVGSMYLIGYANSKTQIPRPCLFAVRNKKGGKGVETYNIPADDGWNFFGHGVVKVHGCGLGATLIHRSVLEKVRFWYYMSTVVKHSDVLFYADLANLGIDIFVDTDILLPHFNSDWNKVADA